MLSAQMDLEWSGIRPLRKDLPEPSTAGDVEGVATAKPVDPDQRLRDRLTWCPDGHLVAVEELWDRAEYPPLNECPFCSLVWAFDDGQAVRLVIDGQAYELEELAAVLTGVWQAMHAQPAVATRALLLTGLTGGASDEWYELAAAELRQQFEKAEAWAKSNVIGTQVIAIIASMVLSAGMTEVVNGPDDEGAPAPPVVIVRECPSEFTEDHEQLLLRLLLRQQQRDLERDLQELDRLERRFSDLRDGDRRERRGRWSK